MRHMLSAAWPMAGRIVLALPGAYVFVWGQTCFTVSSLVAAGLSFHDAETAAFITGFLSYLGLFLWVFATPSLLRATWLLLGGGETMSLLAWSMQSRLLSGAYA